MGSYSVDVFSRLNSVPAGTVSLCPGKVSCDSYLHPPPLRDTLLHLLSDCGDSGFGGLSAVTELREGTVRISTLGCLGANCF